MFDSHAHYDDLRFETDRDDILDRLLKRGVSFVNVGVDRQTSFFGKDLANSFPNVYFSAGIHPENADNEPDFSCWLPELLGHEKCVALGEIGLDYHYDEPSREIQRRCLDRQLDLALSLNKPVIIHDRDAHADCMEAVLSKKGLRTVFHSYSGSREMSHILQQNGVFISFSGVVTFKNAQKIKNSCLAVADEFLMVETDSPYLTPHPFRGQRNNSLLMEHTIAAIAELRGKSLEYIDSLTTENAKRFYRITEE